MTERFRLKDLGITELKKIFFIIVGALLNAVSLNMFLIPAKVYASGFTGVSQLISSLLVNTAFPISTGILYLLFNIPVTILGWLKVGKSFTVYSFLSVIMITAFLEIIPITVVSSDILLNAVFGGVIAALGVGVTLKYGASTGGLDIIAMILSRMKNKPIGGYFFILNGLIILAAGFLFGWEKALYTLVALYVSSRVIDAVHTRHEKLTAMIVTKKGNEIQEAIHGKMVRGITIVPAKGAFSKQDKEMLIIVITRYELYDLEQVLKEVDPNAFTNIVHTTGIYGFFRND
ncbi:MAG: YitT family protein [Bacillota bacterium]|uniref:YitT family protein n=1 Tax=Fictibacillus norfolkensis TaxID=2762233 RepID=A0ABR8SQ70_9BACL|nr:MULTISPECIES: YitT family protein [Fictibacillus]MBD7965647.1 YitT family protein [Fictibacillus norfolkensis]MBH0170517.1 YitT family protein [Fictibacillus sp. 18YEL24]